MEDLSKLFSNDPDRDPVAEIGKKIAETPINLSTLPLLEALEELASRLQPKTTEGLLVQAMIADACVADLANNVEGDLPPSFGRLVRVIVSIVKSLEKECGADKIDYGFDYFALKDQYKRKFSGEAE